MGPVLVERSITLELSGCGVNHTPSWNAKRGRNAMYLTLNFKMPNLFIAKSGIGGKVITGCLLLLNKFCSFLIQTLRSPKLQLGDASFNAACYWMQRTVHCMGFVVEWFIGMRWVAFGFGEKWTAWLCLFLRLSVAHCLLFWAPYPFPLYLPFPTPLCLLKFFQLLSLFLHLQFSFFLCVSKSSSHHQ